MMFLISILSLFYNLDLLTIVLGLFAIFSAIVSFVLAKLEIENNKRLFYGFYAKDIKHFAAYSALVLTLLTLLFQTKKEIDSNIEALKRYHESDSLERTNFVTTLTYIDSTLKIQNQTLDSTNLVLAKQMIMLDKQDITLNNLSYIFKKQGLLSDSINSSIDLIHGNLKKQESIIDIQSKLTKQSIRLLNPFKDIFFSFSFVYDSADKVFPKYYGLMDSIYKNPEVFGNDYSLTFYAGSKDLNITYFSSYQPNEYEDGLTYNLGHFSEFLTFFSRKDTSVSIDDLTNVDLEYRLIAWVPKSLSIFESDIKNHIIICPKKSTIYDFTIDFEHKTLEQSVKFSSYEEIENDHTILSIADIIYPADPENKFIQISAPSFINEPPKLTELTIHFGETYYNSVSIPGILFTLRKLNGGSGNKRIGYIVNIKTIQDYLKKKELDSNIPGKDL